MIRGLACGVLAALALGSASRAQELATIEARVLSASGASVYLDRGREASVRADDRVVLHPPGGATVEAIVRDVSKSSSRAELLPGSPPVPSGSRAEILVPVERLEAMKKKPEAEGEHPPAQPEVKSPPSTPPVPPPHPAWTHPPESWDAETPLLAATAARAPEAPPVHFDGRVFWQTTSTRDSEQNSRYLSSSLGTDLRVENPFGRSGLLEFSADLLDTRASFDVGSDASETDLNVRRLSYSEGGIEERPSRWEVGRFLQREFPELGVIDGFDWSRRTEGGSRFGANFGAMPEPFPGLASGEDLQATVYYGWSPEPSGSLRLGGAFQNSWHEGSQDRSLFLGTLGWNPKKDFTLRSAAWVDHYGPEDTIKSSAFELTELQALATWRFDRKGGCTLSMSHRRIPEMERHEFGSLPPAQVADDRVDRVGLGGWKALGEKTRLRAQLDGWQDQDGDGLRGEVGISRQDLFWDRGEVGLALYTAAGTFSDGEGLRLSASKSFDRAHTSLGYELAQYDQEGFVGDQSTLAHHFLYGYLDFDLGNRWNLSVQGSRQFGDEMDAYTLGLLLQVNF